MTTYRPDEMSPSDHDEPVCELCGMPGSMICADCAEHQAEAEVRQ